MNGIASIHRLLNSPLLNKIRGTLIAIPAINVYGLLSLQRNLPDRRDLDRSFPGSVSGSYAARLAHYLTEEIFSLATHCIDIHTAEVYQHSLPHIQTDLENPVNEQMAKAFQPLAVVHSKSERGLLSLNDRNIPTCLYEAGEPLRLDEEGIRVGFQGILNVMRHLGMVKFKSKPDKEPLIVRSKQWLRAPGSGLCQLFKKLGDSVQKGDVVAHIHDPFGTSQKFQIISPGQGVVITQNTLPLVNEGDAIVCLANTQESFALWEQKDSG